MDFLFSNYPPMKTGNKTFAEAFYSLLPKTSKLDIAVGYVSADSLIELQKTIELNSNIRTLNLILIPAHAGVIPLRAKAACT